MAWDIIFEFIAFAATSAVTYVGWRATADPISPEDRPRRRKYERIIWISFIGGALAIVASGIRSVNVRTEFDSVNSKLSDLTQKQTATITGIEELNRAHIHLERLEIVWNSKLKRPTEIGFITRNTGQSTARNVHIIFTVVPHRGERSKIVEDRLWANFELFFAEADAKRPPNTAPPIEPEGTRESFAPFRPRPADVVAWNGPRAESRFQMYALGKATFEDDSGEHEQDICILLPFAILNHSPDVRHDSCDDHNGEN